MNPLNFALFESSLPDDSVEKGGHIVVPAGRNVMESLSRRLKESGAETSGVFPHSFYGWSFKAQFKGRKVWLMVQAERSWLLIVEDRRSVFRRLFEGRAPFREALSFCDAALKSLDHVSDLEWLTREAYHARGRAEYERRKKTPNQPPEPTAPSGRGSA